MASISQRHCAELQHVAGGSFIGKSTALQYGQIAAFCFSLALLALSDGALCSGGTAASAAHG
jgi:hypothetical protein